MQLLNDSGRLLITHSIGGKQICDILKIAFNNVNAFPSIAKDLIYQLEKEPKNDDYQYDYSEPFSYEFNYTNTPSGSSSELFGREADAKIEALLYFAQITDQEINALNQCSNKILKLRESIQRHSELIFINEFFTVEKSKID